MSSLEKRYDSNSVAHNYSWYNDFADKLLAENFFLTALEFYAELIESGKDLPKLRDFFSNPLNFEHQAINKHEVAQLENLPRSSSQATLDSLDLTRYSEDGERSADDRVAVLEFELRKAKDTINALRANLTEAAESETSKNRSQECNVKEIEVVHSKPNHFIKAHEQRALNFLINEYLLMHGYKLTSITFADENENQDFEDWEDVGLNSARPVELLQLYREGLKSIKSGTYVETKDFECQVAFYDEIKQNLQINELEAEVAQLNNKITMMTLEYSKNITNLENQRVLDVGSQRSETPDPEYFEMIETGKSNEESETKSDKSNGEWTQIGDKFKKESIDLKSDSQSNFESISIDDKNESPFGALESEGILTDYKNRDGIQESMIKSSTNVEKYSENLNEPVFVHIDSEFCESNNKRVNSHSKEEKILNNEILGAIISSRCIPEGFKTQILKHCDIFLSISDNKILTGYLSNEYLKDITSNDVIDLVSNSLPKIIPNIILNKREEVIPILVLSIYLNPDSSKRDILLNLLFNLKKKPQIEERIIILHGLLKIAQLRGPNAVENEILPQCWEQITHKYAERRMLAAESCLILTPYVSEAIRNSLIISIVQQLLQDREESIRRVSVYILTILIALMSDENKYEAILEISLQITNDESADVLNAVIELLFPTLAQWSFSMNKVLSTLYVKLLCKIKKDKNECCIRIIEILLPYVIMSLANSNTIKQFSSDSLSSEFDRLEFSYLCRGLCDPELFSLESPKKSMEAFVHYSSQSEINLSDWPELGWIKNVFVSDLLEAGDNFWENKNILKHLISALRYLCLGLGKNLTNFLIKPFLLEKLIECENAVVSGQDYKCAIIPLYLVGVLSTFPEELQEMSNTLRRFICALPLCGVSLTPLKITVEFLCQSQPWQILILDAIWEGVVHQRPLVRCGSASLLQSVIPHIPEILINTKIMPALVTLMSDPEPSVKTSAIPALGMLTSVKEKAIKDKVHMTFQTLLQESISLENHNLLVQSVKTLGSIYEHCDSKFREEVLLPQLSTTAILASQTKNKELVEVLTEAFSTVIFSQTQVSSQSVLTNLLPALKNLENVCTQLNSTQCELISSIIKDVERRLPQTGEGTSKSTIKSSSEAKRLASVVSTHVVVEDVRNKVNKIFNTKPNTLQNVSGIFKKKT